MHIINDCFQTLLMRTGVVLLRIAIIIYALSAFTWKRTRFPKLQNNDIVCNLSIDPCACHSSSFSVYSTSFVHSGGCIRDQRFDAVHRVYQSRGFTTGWFQTKDKDYDVVNYSLAPNIVSDNTSVCFDDPFLFIMILVRRTDIERRELFRTYLKRGLVEGRRVDYGFFVVADTSDYQAIKEIQEENAIHRDILYSQHVDSYTNVTLTILDAFLWIRDHCPRANFVMRLDGDCFAHVPNAVRYLSTVDRRFYYGGYRWGATLYSKKDKDTAYDVPADYPLYKRYFRYCLGGGYIVSRDVIPYINIGTLYQDLVVHAAEDALLGRVLENAGIFIAPAPKSYILYRDLLWYKFPQDLSQLPQNIIMIHNLKNFTQQKLVFAHYSSAQSPL